MFFYKFLLKWGKMKKNVESNIFFKVQKYYFVFESRLIFFSNGHIRNVVSTFPNVVKIDVSTLSNIAQFNVEKHIVISALFYVVNFNVIIHNIVSTLVWRCAMSRRHINLKTTLNRRWSVCWVPILKQGVRTINAQFIRTRALSQLSFVQFRPYATSFLGLLLSLTLMP